MLDITDPLNLPKIYLKLPLNLPKELNKDTVESSLNQIMCLNIYTMGCEDTSTENSWQWRKRQTTGYCHVLNYNQLGFNLKEEEPKLKISCLLLYFSEIRSSA